MMLVGSKGVLAVDDANVTPIREPVLVVASGRVKQTVGTMVVEGKEEVSSLIVRSRRAEESKRGRS